MGYVSRTFHLQTREDENLVTLKNTTATATRQSNDVIFCTKECLAETGKGISHTEPGPSEPGYALSLQTV